jgi:hypothetical protein
MWAFPYTPSSLVLNLVPIQMTVLFGFRISRTQKPPSGELVRIPCGTSSVVILIEPFLLCNIAQVGVFTLAALEGIDVKGTCIIIQVLYCR